MYIYSNVLAIVNRGYISEIFYQRKRLEFQKLTIPQNRKKKVTHVHTYVYVVFATHSPFHSILSRIGSEHRCNVEETSKKKKKGESTNTKYRYSFRIHLRFPHHLIHL